MSKADLVINLDALVSNWLLMRSYVQQKTDCGAVVKADAYGLGLEPVVLALNSAGCKTFYVSTLQEALELKAVFVKLSTDRIPKIFVLTGCGPEEEAVFIREQFVPVLVSLEMFMRWYKVCRRSSQPLESALKVNTGMGRLGVEVSELESLLADSEQLAVAGVQYLFSHLACADQFSHPMNTRQLKRFRQALKEFKKKIPAVKASLANSAATTFGQEYLFDMVRPGIALYGGQPRLDTTIPLKSVVSLSCPIIQVRSLPAGEFVGYGATRSWTGERVIAIAQFGYADGIFRQLGNAGIGVVAKGKQFCRVPIVGRISMDTTMFDVTDVPFAVGAGDRVELLGEGAVIESQAQLAHTVSYELLTSLGPRYVRQYVFQGGKSE